MLLMTVMIFHPAQSNAQTIEGTVRIVPAIASVDLEHGAFTVAVVLEDLEHFGAVLYDDDRDTVPDREVESIGMGAFEFTIEYNPAILSFDGVQEGTELERTGRDFQCLPPLEDVGSFSFGCISLGQGLDGPQGTMTLAEVTFQPIGTGSTFLLLDAQLAGPLGSDDVPLELRPGAVRVTGRPTATATTAAPPGPSNTATPRPEPSSTPVSTPTATDTPPGPTATPESTTSTVAAPTTTPANGSGDGPGQSDTDGPSAGTVAIWSLTALAGVVVAGTLGLTAARWRRRRKSSEA
jgi:hypothetical protein